MLYVNEVRRKVHKKVIIPKSSFSGSLESFSFIILQHLYAVKLFLIGVWNVSRYFHEQLCLECAVNPYITIQIYLKILKLSMALSISCLLQT